MPFLVLTLTIPAPTSPYSTEGTPEITSTDSTLLEAMLLTVTPVAPEKLALFESLTPSTSTAVPNDAFPASELPPALMLNLWAESRLGLAVAPPGRRPPMSARLTIWTWSSAVLSIVRLVVALFSFSFAVTTTPSRVRLSSLRNAR